MEKTPITHQVLRKFVVDFLGTICRIFRLHQIMNTLLKSLSKLHLKISENLDTVFEHICFFHSNMRRGALLVDSSIPLESLETADVS